MITSRKRLDIQTKIEKYIINMHKKNLGKKLILIFGIDILTFLDLNIKVLRLLHKVQSS